VHANEAQINQLANQVQVNHMQVVNLIAALPHAGAADVGLNARNKAYNHHVCTMAVQILIS
jgi:hypothetical protein